MCSHVYSGTVEQLWVITTEASSLGGLADYHVATFHQWVTPRSGESVTVRTQSEVTLDTQARFPIESGQFGNDILPYLEPTAHQQSDHREIIDQAAFLVEKARTEVEAVVAILDWIGAKVTYDYSFELDNDALSVYRNRSGVCAGYSNLAVALLRSAGIPARSRGGCALWELHGAGHAWIEVYYPDVGWVPSEPTNGMENFIYNDFVIASNHPVRWCGEPSTTIDFLRFQQIPTERYYIRTLYSSENLPYVDSAFAEIWDRHPVRVSPTEVGVMASISDTEATTTLEVESAACGTTSWSLGSEAGWLEASPTEGITRTQVLLSIDAASLPRGVHTTTVKIATAGYDTYERDVPVRIWIVDRVHRAYLPLVSKRLR
jgi:hypothetical protein